MTQETATPGAGSGTPKPRAKRTRTQVTLSTREREAKALGLRLRRLSYDEIAKQCGYANRGAAFKAVDRALKAVPRENAVALRQQELETLDAVQAKLMPQLLRARPSLPAIDRLAKIMDQRAKLTGIHENIADTGIEEFTKVLKAWAGQIAAQVEDEDESESEDADES